MPSGKMDINEANKILMQRRAERRELVKAKPIKDPAAQIANRNGQTISEYWQAIRAGDMAKARSYNASQTLSCSRERWDMFESDRHPDLQRAAKTVVEWYNDRRPIGGALILAGNNGCGKTHMAKAIRDLSGLDTVFWNESDLIKKIQGSYNGRGPSEESILARARRSKLFIYDDLGAYETENWKWLQSIYYNLFDGRYEAGKATIITTNLKAVSVDDHSNVVYDEKTLYTRLGAKSFDRLLGAVEFDRFYVKLFNVPSYRMRNFTG